MELLDKIEDKLDGAEHRRSLLKACFEYREMQITMMKINKELNDAKRTNPGQ